MLARDQRTPFSDWWWTVDKLLLGAIMALMLGGVILSLAASPPVATRIGLDPFHFFGRHVLFLLPSLLVLIGVSFLSPKQIRRLALLVFVVSILLIVATLVFGADLLVPHVAGRIKRFMNPASGDTFQVDMAMEAFWNGGWFGLGPGEGIAKRSLPDSHTDFVFAVAAEEFGIILCLALVSLFAFIVIRTLTRAYSSEDMFARFAVSGLAFLF